MSSAMVADLCVGSVVIGLQESILSTITDRDVHLALWDRTRPATLAWLDHLPWDEIDDIDQVVEKAAAPSAIAQALEDAGYPAGADRQALHGEIVDRAGFFARIMGCERLRWRLEVVETDACRRFHADMVTARLLVSLSGPTTQWIHADAPDNIRAMRLGAVGLFKGRLLTEYPRILHRSPPIAGTEQTRLLLVINPALAADAQEAAGSAACLPGLMP